MTPSSVTEAQPLYKTHVNLCKVKRQLHGFTFTSCFTVVLPASQWYFLLHSGTSCFTVVLPASQWSQDDS